MAGTVGRPTRGYLGRRYPEIRHVLYLERSFSKIVSDKEFCRFGKNLRSYEKYPALVTFVVY